MCNFIIRVLILYFGDFQIFKFMIYLNFNFDEIVGINED